MKFDNDCDVIFVFKYVIEHRFSWNKCFRIHQTNAAQQDATCRNSYQVIKLKIARIIYEFYSHGIM